jgi:hypothetical protein
MVPLSDSSASSNEDGFLDMKSDKYAPPRLLYGLFWIGLSIYAFNFAPGAGAEAAARDADLAIKMITTPFDGDVSKSIFAGIFNSLGVLPAIYASLLLPGSKDQRVPALPFVLGSFAFGFFSVGPYLALRNKNFDVTNATRGRGSGAFESKISAILLLTFSCWLFFYSLTTGDLGAACQGYQDLFWSQRIVHVSTLDALLLSAIVVDPMSEDMTRRNYTNIPAWVFALLPIIGPTVYLLLRPPLPLDKVEKQK